MPTGYTCKVMDGDVTELRDFALECARAFGACIHQRDEPSGPPKPVEVSSYYADSLKESLEEYDEISNLSDDEIIEREVKERNDRVNSALRGLEDKKKKRERYEDMLEKVRDWTPPTTEHESLKEFMINQLNDSIQFDCGSDYYERAFDEAIAELHNDIDPDLIRKNELADIQYSIDYSRGHLEKEGKNAETTNKWIEDLYKSLEDS